MCIVTEENPPKENTPVYDSMGREYLFLGFFNSLPVVSSVTVMDDSTSEKTFVFEKELFTSTPEDEPSEEARTLQNYIGEKKLELAMIQGELEQARDSREELLNTISQITSLYDLRMVVEGRAKYVVLSSSYPIISYYPEPYQIFSVEDLDKEFLESEPLLVIKGWNPKNLHWVFISTSESSLIRSERCAAFFETYGEAEDHLKEKMEEYVNHFITDKKFNPPCMESLQYAKSLGISIPTHLWIKSLENELKNLQYSIDNICSNYRTFADKKEKAEVRYKELSSLLEEAKKEVTESYIP